MPIIWSKMRALWKQYGKKKGTNIYHAMENIAKKKKRAKSRSKRRKG